MECLKDRVHRSIKQMHRVFSNISLDRVVFILGVLISLYHIIYTFAILQTPTQHYVFHLGFLSSLAILAKLRQKNKLIIYFLFFWILIEVLTASYLWLNVERLQGEYIYLTSIDMVMGILTCIPPLIAVWLYFGWIIPALVITFVLYFLYGHLIPGVFSHMQFTPEYVVSFLSTGLTFGLFGYLLPISANYTFYFLLFGGIAMNTGMTDMFLQIGNMIGARLRGGPAYAAVVGSSLIAMVTGGGASNVAITGSVTIPAMKRSGFTPEDAGSIEASASIGGQITPPIMGAAAFVMASFLGVTYLYIIGKAIIGAIIFYIAIFIGVTSFCYSKRMPHYKGEINKALILTRIHIFLVPLAAIIYLLLAGFTATYAVTGGIILLLICSVTVSENRANPMRLIKGLAQGAVMAAAVCALLGSIGLVAQVAVTTSLAPKFSIAIMQLTQQSLLPSLILIAMVTIILGMGLPVTASYTLVAVLMVPTLLMLGVWEVSAHFFVFYFAIWGAISPPVAPAAAVASQISGGSFWGTGIKCFRFMVIPFLLPFVIVIYPDFLKLPFEISSPHIMLHFFALVLGACCLSGVLFKWFIKDLDLIDRLLLLFALIGVITFILGVTGIAGFIGGLGFILAVLIKDVLGRRYHKPSSPS